MYVKQLPSVMLHTILHLRGTAFSTYANLPHNILCVLSSIILANSFSVLSLNKQVPSILNTLLLSQLSVFHLYFIKFCCQVPANNLTKSFLIKLNCFLVPKQLKLIFLLPSLVNILLLPLVPNVYLVCTFALCFFYNCQTAELICFVYINISAPFVINILYQHFLKKQLCYTDAQQRLYVVCLLYTSPSPRDQRGSGMPSSA